jgi:hypothetical protein
MSSQASSPIIAAVPHGEKGSDTKRDALRVKSYTCAC